jgi:hypothetical protein
MVASCTTSTGEASKKEDEPNVIPPGPRSEEPSGPTSDADAAPEGGEGGANDDSTGRAEALGCSGALVADSAPDFRSEFRNAVRVFPTSEGYAVFLRNEGGLEHYRVDERLAEIAPPKQVLGAAAITGTSPSEVAVERDGARFVGAALYRDRIGEWVAVHEIAVDGNVSPPLSATAVAGNNRSSGTGLGLAVSPSGVRLLALTTIPLVAVFPRGASAFAFKALDTACPQPGLLEVAGELVSPMWTGNAFQGFCGARVATVSERGDERGVAVTPAPATDACVVGSSLVRADGDWYVLAWTHPKLRTNNGSLACLAPAFPGLPPDLNTLPEGTELTLRASRLASGAFGAFVPLTSFARPKLSDLGATAVWDGASFAVLTATSKTSWRLARVDPTGRTLGAPASFDVDSEAFAGVVHLVRGGYLVTWKRGGGVLREGAGGAQRIQCR